MKISLFLLLFFGIYICIYSQNIDEQLLNNEIIKNYCDNWVNIDNEFTRYRFDTKKSVECEKYLSRIKKFNDELDRFIFDEDYNANYFKAQFINLLKLAVPDFVEEIYKTFGLGNNGHRIYVTIFFGSFLLQTKNNIKNKLSERLLEGIYFFINERKKLIKLILLEKAINENDLLIIQENLDDLPIAIY